MPTKRSDKARDIDAHIGMRLRAIREWRGYSQGAVAERLGLKSRQAVASYEAGDAIAAAVLFQLTQVLQVDLHAFFEGWAQSGLQVAEEGPERASPKAAQIDALLRRIPAAHHPMILKVVAALADGLDAGGAAAGDRFPTLDPPG